MKKINLIIIGLIILIFVLASSCKIKETENNLPPPPPAVPTEGMDEITGMVAITPVVGAGSPNWAAKTGFEEGIIIDYKPGNLKIEIYPTKFLGTTPSEICLWSQIHYLADMRTWTSTTSNTTLTKKAGYYCTTNNEIKIEFPINLINEDNFILSYLCKKVNENWECPSPRVSKWILLTTPLENVPEDLRNIDGWILIGSDSNEIIYYKDGEYITVDIYELTEAEIFNKLKQIFGEETINWNPLDNTFENGKICWATDGTTGDLTNATDGTTGDLTDGTTGSTANMPTGGVTFTGTIDTAEETKMLPDQDKTVFICCDKDTPNSIKQAYMNYYKPKQFTAVELEELSISITEDQAVNCGNRIIQPEHNEICEPPNYKEHGEYVCITSSEYLDLSQYTNEQLAALNMSGQIMTTVTTGGVDTVILVDYQKYYGLKCSPDTCRCVQIQTNETVTFTAGEPFCGDGIKQTGEDCEWFSTDDGWANTGCPAGYYCGVPWSQNPCKCTAPVIPENGNGNETTILEGVADDGTTGDNANLPVDEYDVEDPTETTTTDDGTIVYTTGDDGTTEDDANLPSGDIAGQAIRFPTAEQALDNSQILLFFIAAIGILGIVIFVYFGLRKH